MTYMVKTLLDRFIKYDRKRMHVEAQRRRGKTGSVRIETIRSIRRSIYFKQMASSTIPVVMLLLESKSNLKLKFTSV